MSYQHGYQQQPQGGYPGSFPEPEERRGNPATAILAAVLGLVAVAGLVIINFNLFSQLEGAPDEVSGEFTPIVIARFAAAGLLLIGAIIVFVRKLAGAIVLVLGGLAGIAAIMLYPVLLSDLFPDLAFGDYLEAMFQFEETQSTFSAVALIASPLALILAILPPTLNYLRGPSAAPAGPAYGGYQQQPHQPQQPGQGW